MVDLDLNQLLAALAPGDAPFVVEIAFGQRILRATLERNSFRKCVEGIKNPGGDVLALTMYGRLGPGDVIKEVAMATFVDLE
jgi:hypothetical protein